VTTTSAAPVADAGIRIRTPDQRLRIFVSSTLRELAEERESVRTTIDRLRLTPVMFELGARPHPPRDLYRAYLDQSDVFLGIYWESYGWIGPGETVSGLEDEYLLSGDRPKLIYVKASSARQPELKALLTRIRDDDHAAYKSFADADDLAGLVADDIAVLLTERFAGTEPRSMTGLRPMTLPVAVTPIIGREAELGAVEALVSDPVIRLVTLIGPGGIGKTRLALEVAAAMEGDAGDAARGVWFVDLTPIRDPDRVMEVVGAALGIRIEGNTPMLDLLVDRLHDRRVLLVLDNFEHVLPAAPAFGELLTACPRLSILVTSRTVLRLRGEREVPLSPLTVPDAEAEDVTVATSTSSAGQLFLARGRQVRPGFALTAANASAVAELCRRLDGIPLALELAAAQLRILSPAQLLKRLGGRLDKTLDLPAGSTDLPDRQRTLRSTVEWSHSLLGDSERALLARLSVFSHTWTLAGAEAVGAAEGDVDVFDVMTSLVSHSLVSLDESDPEDPHFRMLGMVRAFAGEQLDERSERDATLTRLTGYLREFAGVAGTGLQTADNREWAQRVDSELEDLLSAIQRAVQNDDAETVIRISAPLFAYWWSRGLLKTMHAFASQAAGLPSAATLPADAAALLLWARGMFLVSTGNAAEARPLMAGLMAGATEADEPRLRAFGLAGLALTLVQPSSDEAIPLLDEAAAIFRNLQEHWGLAFALSARGQLALQASDAATADLLHSEALGAARAIRNEHLQAQLLDLLGLDALVAGNPPLARTRFTSAAELHLELLDQEGSAYCLDGFATLALTQGHPEVSARLMGASAHARTVLGLSVWPGVQASADRLQAMVTEALGEAAFETLTAAGRHLQTAEALTFAIGATAA
jgi:predicted ATPase